MMVTLAVVPSVPDTFTNTLKSVVFLINTLLGSHSLSMYLCLPLLFSKKCIVHKYTYKLTQNEVKVNYWSSQGRPGQGDGRKPHSVRWTALRLGGWLLRWAHTATQGAPWRGSCAGAERLCCSPPPMTALRCVSCSGTRAPLGTATPESQEDVVLSTPMIWLNLEISFHICLCH